MVQQIFVNLPVKDLDATTEFFSTLGFTFNKQFTNENATCMIIGENIFAMLLVENFFKSFIKKSICDTKRSTEVLLALSLDSRQDVDRIMELAIRAGAGEPCKPQDHGFMYTRSFEDIDGHIWQLFFMEPTHVIN